MLEQLSPDKKKISLKELDFSKPQQKLKIFDQRSIDFLNSISRQLLKNPKTNRIPAFVALAYWLRKSNIKKIIQENEQVIHSKNYQTQPIGLVFHVCPANVDTLFLYSLAVSLLMGNQNILRISKRLEHDFIQNIFGLMNQEMAREEFQIFKKYILIVRYGHEKEINEYISMQADARVIWGGDSTIQHFKSIASQSRCQDILFANRISYALFSAKKYLNLSVKEQSELARLFFNDAYTFDQKGCASPQHIFVLGDEENALDFERIFYNQLQEIVASKYENDVFSLANLKLNQLAQDAIEQNIESFIGSDNQLVFAKSKSHVLPSCGGGYFYLHFIENLKEIQGFINKKTQTISYFGLSEKDIKHLKSITYGLGADRIVPIGKALDFDYIWDGYNLLEALSIKKR